MKNDLISRQAAIDAIEHRLAEPAYQHTGEDWYVGMNCAESELYELPSAQSEPIKINIDDFNKEDWERLKKEWGNTPITVLPSAQPEIIRCKDCIYQTESWSGIKYCEAHGDHIGKDYDYCSNARRRDNG